MDLNERVAALTPGEREVLPLMLQHTDTKLIARDLGISTSAVDKRLSGARLKLGVTRSIDAALLFARAEGIEAGRTVQVAAFPPSPAAINSSSLSPSDAAIAWSLRPTRGRPWNTQPVWVRLVLIIAGLLVITIVTVLAIDIADTWSRLIGR